MGQPVSNIPHACGGLALVLGLPGTKDPMLEIAAKQHAGLTPQQFIMLQRGLSELHQVTGGCLRIGTALSGTDVIIHSLNVLFDHWRQQFGTEFHVEHAYSIEHIEAKRRFILAHWQPQYIFEDLTKVATDEFSLDLRTKALVRVPHTHVLAAGIECDSISSLNQHASANRGCVGQRQGRTGMTAGATLDLVARVKPWLLLFENVKNLNAGGSGAKTDLAVLLEKLHGLGCTFVSCLAREGPL